MPARKSILFAPARQKHRRFLGAGGETPEAVPLRPKIFVFFLIVAFPSVGGYNRACVGTRSTTRGCMQTQAVTVDHVEVMRAGRTVRKELLRQAYTQVQHRSPTSKAVSTIHSMLADAEVFDDFVEQHGGDEMMTRVVCARVANQESLEDLCAHYCINYGLLWEWISEDAQRLERYFRAQKGVADRYVSGVVAIADGATPETLGVDKWRGESRFKAAEKLDPVRFGKQEAGLAGSLENLADVLQRISERKRQPAVIEADVQDVTPMEPV
jgi:hypothetical protein